uniref:Ammonium transporter AmtB-like domain-containing protein n=1 Tax=Entomoneis paludosa TaxID=265537 RepID=A0A7S2VEY5_9STRA|mmetsp:Transcript_18857/g.39067  ORF Transcript_18857/g.39067 Transcript_18857/m.39067 type:complete len:848 (+) Transcript_18857:1-2544(+)
MGLAQAGMIRRKNSLSMLMQVLFGMTIGSLLWVTIGFTLSFGESSHGLIGDASQYFMLRNVPITDCLPDLADSIPASLFAAFQMMFALMTPLIVTGAWCEKMRFEAFLMFIVLWPIFAYYPLVHWVWNPTGWLHQMNIADFAGGLVIHSNTGMAGLAVSYMFQRRKLHALALSHHNLPLSFAGAALVWSGWYSFNGGSATKANFQAAGALMNTHLSASAGAMAWSFWNVSQTGKWSLIECVSGAFAGLGGITAGSGFVEPWAAILIGITAATASFWSVRFFKGYLRLDDVLDVTSLQGTAGVVGSLMVGLFATEEMQPGGGVNGYFYGGGWTLFSVQVLGTVVTLLWSGCWTFLIVSFMKATVGIDVESEVEETGLDLTQIGEQAYDQRLDLLHDIGAEALGGMLNEACSTGDVDDVHVLISRQGADPHLANYDGRRPVHVAAASGRLNTLKYLHQSHAVDLNVEDTQGNTPLLEALRNRNITTVKWLRENGATLGTAAIESEFFDICARGDRPTLRFYVEAGADVNMSDYDFRTPLMIAASNGHPKTVKELLKAGANTNIKDRWGRTAETSAELELQAECANILKARAGLAHLDSPNLDDSMTNFATEEDFLLATSTFGSSTLGSSINTRSSVVIQQRMGASLGVRDLCYAASIGNIDEAKRLVNKGVKPGESDYDNRTPLHLAAASGKLEFVEYLCELPTVNVNAMDRWHHTPIHEAIKQGHDEIAAILLFYGAVQINRNLGYDLCSASSKADVERLEYLKSQGADMSTGDYDVRTALHLAASNGHLAIVKFLVANGARTNAKDRYGATPKDDATREGFADVAEYLARAMKMEKAVSSRKGFSLP